MKTRNIKLDNFKGILIFLVVMGHCLFSYNYFNNDILIKIVNFIYSFHMPLFLIISGYLSKNNNKKNTFNLLILFFIMYFSFIIYDFILNNEISLFNIKYSSWYLIVLYLYRLIINNKKISKFIINNKQYVLIFSFLLSIISGYFYIFRNNFTILRIFSFFIFFIYGYLLDLNNIKHSNNTKHIIIRMLSLIISLVIIFPPNLNFFTAGTYNNNIEPILRLIFYAINLKIFPHLYAIIPKRKLKFLTTIGNNSLTIYLFHRIFTLIIVDYFILSKYFIIISIISTFTLCLLFGNNYIAKFINNLLNKIYQFFINHKIKFICYSIAIFLFPIIISYFNLIISSFNKIETISYEEIAKIDNSITIGFVGDLILLEDQVKNSYINGKYNFDYMFKYTKEYFSDTDYMIGILEGPVDDNKKYSIGNFDDGKEIRLNYPSSFLTSIKDSGIDLVSTSNNHLLDNGIDSAYATIDNLKSIGLDYTGSYKKGEIKNRKIINVDNLKIGILSYTYGINYHTEEKLVNDYNFLTNYLCDSSSKYFLNIKKQVENDFSYLKNKNVDLIIVIPHMGTQFINREDNYQKLWNGIFLENGANIILGDHSHSVQPIYYKDNNVVINSPGNYVNSYIGHDGDISMMIKIYIDKDSKKINCMSVIPMLANKDDYLGYYPIPIYDYYNNINLNSIKEPKLNRLNYANELVTKVSFNKKISHIENEYFYFPNNQYKKQNKYIFKLTDNDKNSIMYKKIKEHNNICFIGDSITEGTLNSYYPWYYPYNDIFYNKNFINISKGSYTSKDIIDNFSYKIKNSNCDLFVINIGTNDIRYNMTNEKEYINNINKIISFTNNKEILLLSPWRTTNKDKNLKKYKKEKKKLYDLYDNELRKIADYNDKITFINVNTYIRSAIKANGEDIYLSDGVHPNEDVGIKLYAFSGFRN